MKTKHTPGPWAVEKWNSYGQSSPVVTQVSAFAEDGNRAMAIHISGCCPFAFVEANAKLIAAAPELLEALQDMLDARHHPLARMSASDKAIAAIKKATE